MKAPLPDGGHTPRPAAASHAMIYFIIRRLFLTVFLLLLVSLITFAIFFLVPRLAGQTTYELAAQYVGRNPIPSEIKAVEVKLGLNAPLYLQYGRYVKGIVLGAHYNDGTDVSYCPFPVLRLLVPQPAAGLAAADQRRPGHAVAGHRGRRAVADRRRGHRRAVRAAPRQHLRPALDGRRAGRGVAAGVLHRPDRAGAVQLQVAASSPTCTTCRITANPLLWARNLVLPWITLAFLYAALYARLTRAGMLETMGEDYIRTARAKGLPERAVVVKHGLRAALTPDRHHLRPGPRAAARRRDPHRDDVLPARPRPVHPRWPSRTRTCPRSWASSCSPRSSS